MIRFWSQFLVPLLTAYRPRHIVEIGAQAGGNTRNILEFCAKTGAHATIIDPLPIGNIELIADLLSQHGKHEMGLSLDVLPHITGGDAYLIDGDHNYYTVYHEIDIIIQNALNYSPDTLPILLFHDVGWPYGKRDLYYDPSTIPPEGVLPYVKGGITPAGGEPTKGEGFNAHLCNAIDEATPKNGVFTAIEDMAVKYEEFYRLYRLPGWHGLALMAPKAGLSEAVEAVISERFELSKAARTYLDALELSRCELLVKHDDARRGAMSLASKLRATEKQFYALKQQREKELEQMDLHFSQLYTMVDNLFKGSRWRIGNAIGDILTTLQRKERQKPIFGHLQTIKHRYENASAVKWLRERDEALDGQHFMHSSYDEKAVEFVADRLGGKNNVTIIIPIYNAPDETRRCIESVLRKTRNAPYNLLLINDASPSEKIRPLLAEYADLPQVRILHHEKNQGFVHTVNHGMRESTGDVILLNSDTEVTSRWLQKMVMAASIAPNVATVTPLSNAAGPFSVPESGKDNEVPTYLGLAGMARLVENLSDRRYPKTPTGHGFALYIKRETLEDVGLFDAETFPRGYGEENDFCMRAGKKGWVHVIDDATYIYHQRSASFGTEKEKLIKDNRARLDAKHPEYTAKVREFLAQPELGKIRKKIQNAVTTHQQDKPRILYVMHQGGGGTPYTNMDLMQHIDETRHCFLLTSDAKVLMLWEVLPDRRLEKRFQWPLPARWQVTDFYHSHMRALYFAIFARLNVDLVHIRHLMGHTFDLPVVAKTLGLPIVFSFHDFYFACPSVHLLDSNGTYCGGHCHAQKGQCKYPLSWFSKPPHLASFNAQWRGEVSKMLTHVDRFVTTTEAAKAVIVTALGDAVPSDRFHIIEHGRDFTFPEKPLCRVPEIGKPLSILLPGQLGFNKGIELVRAIKSLDHDNRLHFHFLGTNTEALADLGTVHGAYEREEFLARVAVIAPAFIGIFSIWSETYCHTLSEAWAAGIPVIASNIGAIAERVQKHQGGWLIDYMDAQKAYEQILAIGGDEVGYRTVADNVAQIRLRTTHQMAEDYLTLYEQITPS